MSNTERDIRSSEALGYFRRLAVKDDRRTFALWPDDFNVPPSDAVVPSRAKSFHRGFFRGKTGGVPLVEIRLGAAVTYLTIGEHAMQKTIAVTLNGLANTRYLRDIDTGPDNHELTLAQPGRRAELLKEHAIPVGIEAVFLSDGMPIGIEHKCLSAERANQHEQAGFRQVKVGE